MPKTLPLSSIPTLSSLYRAATLHPPQPPSSSTFQPSASLNDRVSLVQADITTLAVDAIVNAAKPSLLGGGGVDGAIHRAAGPKLVAECKSLGEGCPTGEARITGGHKLPAAHVIHTVGPRYTLSRAEQSEGLLRSCYAESLRLAAESGLESVAFSAISTGIYGYPSDEAAKVACEAAREFLLSPEGSDMKRVIFVTFVASDHDAYVEALPQYFPPAEDTDEAKTALQ